MADGLIFANFPWCIVEKEDMRMKKLKVFMAVISILFGVTEIADGGSTLKQMWSDKKKLKELDDVV